LLTLLAAAKFLSGHRIDGHVRKQEILDSVASRLKRAALRHRRAAV
jgi:hypothetical protein